MRENPYRLAFDVWGIGFLSADRLALALGLGAESDARMEAGVRHVLESSAGSGHVYLPREDLVEAARGLLQAEPEKVQLAIDRLAKTGDVALEAGDLVYSAALYRAEVAVCTGITRLLEAPMVGDDIDVVDEVTLFERDAKFQLAPRQREAIETALQQKVAVITGGPGVGKTTIVRAIVQILQKYGVDLALAAPTGRAAKRLAEATLMPALTLHRLLEWHPKEGGFGRNADNPLAQGAVIVDEASMIDVRLAADLLAAVAAGARFVLVGDVDQLPSVGPGRVLRDIIESKAVPTVRLTEIFRQATASLIVTNAHRINQGEAPKLEGRPNEGQADNRDFFFVEAEAADQAATVVRDLVVSRVPKHFGFSPWDCQVLVPMHRGDIGAARINDLLQDALTPGAAEWRRGNRLFRLGDKVMQIRNNYDKDVFNGDVGRVVRVGATAASSEDDVSALVVRFDDRDVAYSQEDLDEVILAYATTVHKSQGSEYPVVILPVHTQHFVMLQRNLLYTGVTRGKQLVILVGTKRALALAVRNADVAKRHSALGERLRLAAQGVV